MKEIKVTVSLTEVLEFVKNEEDCKIEIDYNKNDKTYDAYVLPINAAGYERKINTQPIEAYDYKEFNGDEEAYIDWLSNCYDIQYEAENGKEEYLIKIDFEK